MENPYEPAPQKRLTIILAISLGLVSVTGLVLYALSQNIDLFYTPSELVEGKGPEKIRSPRRAAPAHRWPGGAGVCGAGSPTSR